MIYSDILTKTEQVRDRLVSAINSKGGSLAANASLNQCADAVTNLPEGGTGGGAEIPGQIFYASFAEDSEYAESGQPLVKIGTLVFSTVDGIPCVRLGEGGFQVDYPLFTGDKPFTISYWGKCVTENDPGPLTVHQGQFSVNRAIFVTHNAGNFHASNSNGFRFTTAIVSEKFVFHHYLVTYDQKKFRLFVDNEQLAESDSEFSLNIPRDPFYIGYNSQSINTNQFYLANMRIFTRVLSAGEISTLYEEFRRATGSGGDDGGSGESGGGEGGGSSIYTGDLVATVYGTPVGDITATLTCVNPDAIRQNDVVWEGKATAIIDYSFSVNTYSGKWSLNVDTETMGDIAYGGDNFTTDNSVPWGATWTNTGGTSRTCEVSKA